MGIWASRPVDDGISPQSQPERETKRREERVITPPYEAPRFGLGILGCGQRATSVVSTLLRLNVRAAKAVYLWDELPGASLQALNRLRGVVGFEELLDRCTPEESPQIIRCETMEEVLQRGEVHWIFVGSMNCRHLQHVRAAFAAGKHVFCEKPLAHTMEDAVEIWKIAKDHESQGQQMIVGFVLRYAEIYDAVKKVLSAEGETSGIGKIVSVEANELLEPDHGGYIFRDWRRHRELAGPHILEKCCHDIDMLNALVCSVPTQVACFGGNSIFIPSNTAAAERLRAEGPSSSPATFEGWGGHDLELDPFMTDKDVEDVDVAIIKYRNGVFATFHTNACSSFNERRLVVCGVEGAVKADLIENSLLVRRIARGSTERRIIVGDGTKKGSHGGGDVHMAIDWLRMIEGSMRGEVCQRSDVLGRPGVDECLIATVTAVCLDRARLESRVVDLEDIWNKLGF